jgi:hypothetical protein
MTSVTRLNHRFKGSVITVECRFYRQFLFWEYERKFLVSVFWCSDLVSCLWLALLVRGVCPVGLCNSQLVRRNVTPAMHLQARIRRMSCWDVFSENIKFRPPLSDFWSFLVSAQLNLLKLECLLSVPPGSTLKNSACYAVRMALKADGNYFQNSVYRLVLLIEVHCVLSEVRTESLYSVQWGSGWVFRPCLGSGGYLPAYHPGGSGSIPGRSMSDLWWTKWQWDRFFSQRFSFPVLSIIPPMLHTHLHIHVALN